MTDIVDRLRRYEGRLCLSSYVELEAAQEIEKLRKEEEGWRKQAKQYMKRTMRLKAQNNELFEALETLAENFEYYMGDNECRPLENARAAIAKAKGVTE